MRCLTFDAMYILCLFLTVYLWHFMVILTYVSTIVDNDVNPNLQTNIICVLAKLL